MARITLLLTLLALALPATALARPVDEAALATERYYQSYGSEPTQLVTAAPAASCLLYTSPSPRDRS